MKKNNILIALCMMLFMASCDNYLDIKPTGSVIPTTLAEHRALWANTYNSIPADRGLASFASDEMYVNNETDRGSYGDIEIWNTASGSASTVSFSWAKYYNALFMANHLISNYKDITDGSEADIEQLRGEAYLMRAYLHFVLVNLYGQPYTREGAPGTKSVPLKLDTDLEKTYTRNTVEEVYTSLLADMDEAGKLLHVAAWDDITLSYRFTTLCVPAIRSRVYLYMGKWVEAYKDAEAALTVKDTLEDYTAATFKLANTYNSVEAINPLEYTITSNYQNAASPTESLLNLYGEGDLRPAVYFSQPDADGKRSCLKGGSNEFRCTIRTSELYLNSAEAAARQGMLPQARTRLLQLMKHRYTAQAYAAKEATVNAMEQEALLAEILNERARELAFEGHRWFDLRRTTRPRLEKTVDGKTYVLEQDDSRYTFRIPNEAIQANPELGK